MTAKGQSQGMRRLAVLLALLSLLALAGSAGAGGVPPFPRLPGAWTHADINVTIKKKPHTLTLDRGKITQVSDTQLTIRERDGKSVTLVVVPLTPSAIVNINGASATIYFLRRGMNAQTMRIDGGPAVRIRATT
jgi:hypothetical protein